ncbi:DNA cytosine methyltransferase [Amycolatopsis ruanii]|uniref:DNA cytosine methyltransferase n=1 Tax=Amycolatopsis ruanii TaxID=944491 RepID=UPI000E289975|nr:DNA cytosine methyltransferase [Amycolatopsis ruanii]
MFTVTDLFCGAGGSGLGATAVPGVELVMAANHSPRAIETHAANFPGCEHDCADISQVEPRRYRRTNILWASPECTNHSIAKGRKRASVQPSLFDEPVPDHVAERSRATMWDVPRFAEVHRYDAVIVENVVDAAKWAPFRAWLLAMDSYGYEHKIVSLNSMHAPAIAAPRAPQSRDRMYVVFWRKGNPAPNLDIRPKAWCPTCEREVRAIQAWKGTARVGRYRQQYLYRCPSATCRHQIVEPYVLPAAAAIDWSLPGQRIGDRDKPLSAKTLARIRAGMLRYATPQLVTAGGSWNDTSYPTSQPFRTRTTREAEGLIVPLEGRDGKEARHTGEPFRTQTTRHQDALVVPYYGTATTAAPAADPIGTLTTRDRYGLAFIAELRGGGSTARDVREPLATVCASGNHHMLVRQRPASQPHRAGLDLARFAVGTDGTTHNRGDLPPAVANASFRMLTVAEIQAAMAFTPDYVITGSKREQVRQLGNGVTPPAAEWLVRSVVASLDTTVHDSLEAA